MNISKSFIKRVRKDYEGTAEPRIENRHLVIREIRPNIKGLKELRPFIDGRYRIRLTVAQILQIRQWGVESD